MKTIFKRISFVFAMALVLAMALPAGAQTPQPAQPITRITSPVREQKLQGSVSVIGTATAPGFSRYEVSYALEPDTKTWVVIGGGTAPVDNGALAQWNTRPLADGAYALRVQVFTSDGKVLDMPTAVRNLSVANAVSVTPAAGSITQTNSITSARPVSATTTSTSDIVSFDLGAIPRAFGNGIKYAAMAIGALLAYLLLKRVFWLVWRRARGNRVDYGE